MQQNVRAYVAPAPPPAHDPLDAEETELRKKRDKLYTDYRDELLAEANRHKVDPKRERWSAIASAVGNTISGIAGAVGVANGAVHPKLNQPDDDFYEKQRAKRKEALTQLRALDQTHYNEMLSNLQARRKRNEEAKQRALTDEYTRSRIDTEKARAESERERTRRYGIQADNEQAYQDARTDNLHARSEASRRPKPQGSSSGGKKKSLNRKASVF